MKKQKSLLLWIACFLIPKLFFGQQSTVLVPGLLGNLEVIGVAGNGKTVGAFGTDGSGISIQRDFPAIGFNQFNANNFGYDYDGELMLGHYGAVFKSDPVSGNINWNMLKPDVSGVSSTKSLSISVSKPPTAGTQVFETSVGFGTDADPDFSLKIGYNYENTLGTAVFLGSKYHSHFCYSANEDTYIRGGKNNSKVIINETPTELGKTKLMGKVSIGLGGSLNPALSLEVAGGMSMSNKSFVNEPYTTFDPGNFTNFSIYSKQGSSVIMGTPAVAGQIVILKADYDFRLSYDRFKLTGDIGHIYLKTNDTVVLMANTYYDNNGDTRFYSHYRWLLLSYNPNN